MKFLENLGLADVNIIFDNIDQHIGDEKFVQVNLTEYRIHGFYHGISLRPNTPLDRSSHSLFEICACCTLMDAEYTAHKQLCQFFLSLFHDNQTE